MCATEVRWDETADWYMDPARQKEPLGHNREAYEARKKVLDKASETAWRECEYGTSSYGAVQHLHRKRRREINISQASKSRKLKATQQEETVEDRRDKFTTQRENKTELRSPVLIASPIHDSQRVWLEHFRENLTKDTEITAIGAWRQASVYYAEKNTWCPSSLKWCKAFKELQLPYLRRTGSSRSAPWIVTRNSA